jgi:hypothetical protein
MNDTPLWRSGSFFWVLLGLVILAHWTIALVYLGRENLPPTYDPSYHLLRTLDFADQLTGKEPTGPLRILRTSYYYPPLFYWTAVPFQVVWGPSKDAAVSSLLIYLSLAMLATYGIGSRLFSRPVGLIAAVLLCCYPVIFGLAREFYPDLPLVGLVGLGFYALLVSDGFRNRRGSVLFGVATGLGMLSKWTYPIFLIGPVAYFLWRGLGRLELHAGFRQFWNSGKRNQALGWYLVSAMGGALALFLWLRVTERSGRRISEHGVMAVVFFHLFAGSMLCFLQSVRLVHRHFPRIQRCAAEAPAITRNAVWAIATAGLIAGPWYVVNARELVYRLVYAALRDAEARAMPGVFSLSSFVEYLIFLEGHQLHLVFFVLFVMALGYHLYKRTRPGFLLLGTVAVAYSLLSLIRLKDPRFSAPYVPFIAILSAGFLWDGFRNRFLRGALTGLVLAWGVFQMMVITFNDRWLPGSCRLPDFKGRHLRGKAELIIFKKYGWGSDRYGQGDWQSGRILDRLEERWGDEVYPARVAVVGNFAYFHYSGFEFLSRARDQRFEFFPALEVGEEGIEQQFRKILASDFILVKEGGDLGPVFGENPYQRVVDSLNRKGGQLALNFRHIATDHLPDRSQVKVYRRGPHEAWTGRPQLRFEPLAVLESYRAWPVTLDATGEIRVEVTWQLHPEILGPYRFFMHIYDLEGEYQFALDDGFEPFRGILDRSSGELQGPVTTEHTISLLHGGKEGLAPGQYSLAVGIWCPDDGSRLRVRQDDKDLGDIFYLDVPLQVRDGEGDVEDDG